VSCPLTILVTQENAADVPPLQNAFARAGLPETRVFVKPNAEALDFICGNEPSQSQQDSWPKVVLVEFPAQQSAGGTVLQWFKERPSLRLRTLLISYNSSGPLNVDRAKAMGADFFLLNRQSVADLLTTVRAAQDFYTRMG
jgi:hypothetical protein